MLVIDKPVTTTDPPELPPFLRKKKGGPERRTIILPDIVYIEHQSKIYDHENNWITIVYQWMDRIIGESLFDPDAKWECAHAHSRQYRQWLETYERVNGVPPHIQFGGAIKSDGIGDPTFYLRWCEWARETFG